MNELKALESLGLTLPSPAYIAGLIVFGIVGWATFRHGRRHARPELTWTGLALMLYPYAVDETWLLWVVGLALSGWVAVRWRAA